MINFDILGKETRNSFSTTYMIFQEKCFSCYILLVDLIPTSDCFYFLRYWASCALQLLVNQAVALLIFKLTISF